MSRLKDKYQQEVIAKLKKELELKNVNEVPKLEKVVLNIGLGRVADNARALETAENTLRKITGQAPVKTVAKQSIAAFKLREGSPIGMMVTLRGERMYEFLDRLVSLVLPRTRDFRGLSRKAFDKHGNYSIGLKDQSVFPELTYEETAFTHGLQVNIITSTDNSAHSAKLFEALGFPLEKTAEKVTSGEAA